LVPKGFQQFFAFRFHPRVPISLQALFDGLAQDDFLHFAPGFFHVPGRQLPRLEGQAFLFRLVDLVVFQDVVREVLHGQPPRVLEQVDRRVVIGTREGITDISTVLVEADGISKDERHVVDKVFGRCVSVSGQQRAFRRGQVHRFLYLDAVGFPQFLRDAKKQINKIPKAIETTR
jgi:hypothetical protein